MRRESLLYDLTNGLFGVLHPIFYASDTYRATWCIHLSVPLALPRAVTSLSFSLSPFSSGPTFEVRLFHGSTRAPFLLFLTRSILLRTTYPDNPRYWPGY